MGTGSMNSCEQAAGRINAVSVLLVKAASSLHETRVLRRDVGILENVRFCVWRNK